MKKCFLLFIVMVLATTISMAQNPLQNCITSSFHTVDSTLNHADRFMLWQDCVKGKQMPEFSVKTLKGEKIKTKDLQGKIVVLNLWFIDCLPCIKELPALNKLVTEYRDRKDVIFLSVTFETSARIEKDFFSKYKLDFEVVPDAMKVVELFGKPGFPTTFVIGRDGKVSASWTCLPVATSTVVGRPVAFFACCNHGNPFAPIPSNIPGFVLGFQIPALSMSTLPVAVSRWAVSITCDSVSALQGPLMINGRLAQAF